MSEMSLLKKKHEKKWNFSIHYSPQDNFTIELYLIYINGEPQKSAYKWYIWYLYIYI